MQKSESEIKVSRLRCEYAVNPIGIGVRQPLLSWIIESVERGIVQSAYQVTVSAVDGGLLWDSGRVETSQSTNITYAGAPVKSGVRYSWKVQIRDNKGRECESEEAFWEMGLLEDSDWQAKWISAKPEGAEPTALAPAAYLRKPFSIDRQVKRARLYSSALGVYEPYLNGVRVGENVLDPGWTDYSIRVYHQTFDVTELLRNGRNAFGMVLGDGWYSGWVGGVVKPNVYGPYPVAIAQLVIEYTDGSTEVVATDDTWKTSTGPILQSDLLMGEVYDARLDMPGWSKPDFEDTAWSVVALADPGKLPEAQVGPPVRKIEEIKPISVVEASPGVFVFDMGQNMVGWARLKVSGKAGDSVTLRFAEILQSDGRIYTENLRGAKATDTYVLKGSGVEVFEPSFTFHGFRYVEVTGYPGTPTLDEITGVVVHSDTPMTGHFKCSHAAINQLQHNILWGQKGNFLSVPTDCPQRDERLGWTGDAQVFVRTATFNMDVASFFTKWLVDLTDDQTPEGAFPDLAPHIVCGVGNAAWGDAGVICPWTIYQAYGDTRVLEKHYQSMAAWVQYCKSKSEDLIRPDEGYSDWLSINANTPPNVLGTAYFAYSTRLVSKIASVLGYEADAQKYEALFQQIKAAFNHAFVDSVGRITGDTQTCYVLALRFDLLPKDQREIAVKYLVEDIKAKDWHLSAGFVGVGYLLPVLTQTGNLDTAYRLLLRDTFPSWLYPVKHGATTIWERWDGWTAEKGFQDPGMNSFNHYSLGSVGEWMYATVAGIDLDPANPGYKHLIIRPRPGEGITSAEASLMSVYSRVATDWKLVDGKFTLDVTIPANTTATVYIPASDAGKVTESAKPASEAECVSFLRVEDGAAVYEVGSGEYHFQS